MPRGRQVITGVSLTKGGGVRVETNLVGIR